MSSATHGIVRLTSLPSAASEGLRFVLGFVGISSALYSAYRAIPEGWLRIWLRGYATGAGALLRLFDPELQVVDNQIKGRFALEVAPSCDAGDAAILLAAAILAFPCVWRQRIVGLVAATSALSIANVLRICSLYWVGAHDPSRFGFVHTAVWPAILLAFVSCEFVFWASRVHRPSGGELIQAPRGNSR